MKGQALGPRPEKLLSPDPEESSGGKGGMGNWLVMGAVGLLAGAGGFAVPLLFAKKQEPAEPAHEPPAVHAPAPAVGGYPAYVPFGPIVVNLADDRGLRYLNVSITLMVDAAYQQEVQQAIDANKPALRSWLISYLADKQWDEVKGRVGVNRAKREILEHFNAVLFPDSERVQDVLFEEFVVQ